MDEALKLGDRIAIMKGGQIIQFNTPLQLMQKPKNDFVKEFTGANRIMKALQMMTLTDLPKDLLKSAKEDLKFEGDGLDIETDLQSALEMLLTASTELPVFDDHKKLVGVLTLEQLMIFLKQNSNN